MASEAGEAANLEMRHDAMDASGKREISYRDILEDLPAAIYTTDADGRITYFNKACVEFSGRTPVIGDDLWCVGWKLYSVTGEPLPPRSMADGGRAPRAPSGARRRGDRGAPRWIAGEFHALPHADL